MARRSIIIVSLAAHLALAIGVLVAGAWTIEPLDRPRSAGIALGVMLPPGDLGGGGDGAAARPAEPLKPKAKRRVKEPVQPVKPPAEVVAETSASTVGTSTSGSDGSGGTGTGGTGGDGNCEGAACGGGGGGGGEAAVCGDGRIEGDEACDDGNRTNGDGCSATCAREARAVPLIPPKVLAGLRISGDTQIVPPDPVKTMMLREGRERTSGTLKVCVAASGAVSSVAIVASTKYPAYDARLLAAVRAWRYHAYTVNGAPTPACGAVTFVYTIR